MQKNSSNQKGVELSNRIDNLLNANKDSNFIVIIPTAKLRFLENVFCLTFSQIRKEYAVKTAYQYLTEPIKDFTIIASYLTPNECSKKYFELMEERKNEK